MKTYLPVSSLVLLFGLLSATQGEEPDLATWLAEHPLISEALRWQDSNEIRGYPNWSETQKADLHETYQAVWRGQSLELTDPPPNERDLADGESIVTVLSEDHAWSLFMAHVAFSLAVETGGWVPWSLTEYSREELLELFDGSRTFRRTGGGYEPRHRAVPAPPDATFEFLSANLMIAQDRLQTIETLLEWCRGLVHFLGGLTAKNMEGHWQYRGEMPVSRVLSGTTPIFYPYKKGDTSPPRELTYGHYTAGCWGTTAFLRAVLRVVNIPVMAVTGSGSTGTHSMPYFMSEGKYLSHSDDLYSQNTRSSPGFPIGELYIDQGTYDAWFGPDVSLPPGKSNVSRRVSDLTIEYLPRILLAQRCRDIREGRSRSRSLVWSWVGRASYSVEELEALNLWDRIDGKIDGLGGCPIDNSWIVFEPRTPAISRVTSQVSDDLLVVEVRDGEGQPVEGHLVTFTVTSGGGTLSVMRTTTHADGRAESRLTRGDDAETNSVSVFAAGVEQPVIFSVAGKAIPRTLTPITDYDQEGPAGTQLAEPFVVEIRDQNGSPLSGATVTFAVTAGGGTLSATTDTTDANGIASTSLTLGRQPGANTVQATVEGLEPVTFTATGLAVARTLDKPSGDGQEGAAGAALSEALVVEVRDQNGQTLAGVEVTFAVTAGGGTLSSTTATTDADGRATTMLTLGRTPGTNEVTATVADLEPVTFTATAEATPDFNGDGVTDLTDFYLFAEAFGGTDPRFDLDGSGTVDFADFFLFAESFGDSARARLAAMARERIGLPGGPQLQQNVPNPFNSSTVISWFQMQPGLARLEVFALTGQRVAVLHEGSMKAGLHRSPWDGRDDRGRPLASGVYLYRLITPERVHTRRLTLLR